MSYFILFIHVYACVRQELGQCRCTEGYAGEDCARVVNLQHVHVSLLQDTRRFPLSGQLSFSCKIFVVKFLVTCIFKSLKSIFNIHSHLLCQMSGLESNAKVFCGQ